MTNSGVWLENLTWQEAEPLFTSDRIVVLPLGASAKEHGPHLPLCNDARIATWLAESVRQQLPVLVAPLINAHFYPAFSEYPGSISLRPETARDLVIDICTSLSRFGSRRFYVLNTGVSTEKPLEMAAQALAEQGLTVRWLKLDNAWQRLPETLLQQEFGTHADERETSLMLHIAPEIVEMARATRDGGEGSGYLSRSRGQGTYSPSGVFGDATLASAEKGEQIARALVDQVCEEIRKLTEPS